MCLPVASSSHIERTNKLTKVISRWSIFFRWGIFWGLPANANTWHWNRVAVDECLRFFRGGICWEFHWDICRMFIDKREVLRYVIGYFVGGISELLSRYGWGHFEVEEDVHIGRGDYWLGYSPRLWIIIKGSSGAVRCLSKSYEE